VGIVDLNNLTPDAEAVKKQAEEVAAGNERSYTELAQKMGPSWPGMDTADARRETLIECLVEWGIITPEQLFRFELAFHKKIETALNSFWTEVRNQEGKQKFTVVKNDTKLLGPNGRPL
jgi:hypothetical protein